MYKESEREREPERQVEKVITPERERETEKDGERGKTKRLFLRPVPCHVPEEGVRPHILVSVVVLVFVLVLAIVLVLILSFCSCSIAGLKTDRVKQDLSERTVVQV